MVEKIENARGLNTDYTLHLIKIYDTLPGSCSRTYVVFNRD